MYCYGHTLLSSSRWFPLTLTFTAVTWKWWIGHKVPIASNFVPEAEDWIVLQSHWNVQDVFFYSVLAGTCSHCVLLWKTRQKVFSLENRSFCPDGKYLQAWVTSQWHLLCPGRWGRVGLEAMPRPEQSQSIRKIKSQLLLHPFSFESLLHPKDVQLSLRLPPFHKDISSPRLLHINFPEVLSSTDTGIVKAWDTCGQLLHLFLHLLAETIRTHKDVARLKST